MTFDETGVSNHINRIHIDNGVFYNVIIISS